MNLRVASETVFYELPDFDPEKHLRSNNFASIGPRVGDILVRVQHNLCQVIGRESFTVEGKIYVYGVMNGPYEDCLMQKKTED